MDNEASRRLCGMCGHVRTQCGNSEVRTVVYKSAVLQSKGNMTHKSVVHASAVNKCRASLLRCRGNESSRVARRIKHERSRSCEYIGPHPGNIHGNVDDDRSGRLMHVGLDAKVSTWGEILLRVAVVPVTGFRTEPAVDVKAVVHKEAACVRGMLQCSVLLCIFGAKS